MKTNLNKVELIGFAGMNAEVKEIKKGVKVANFRLATSDGYKDKAGEWVNSTTWHNIVLWNDSAEKAAAEVKKGSRVSLTGKISYRNYENKAGEKRNIVEIIAYDLQLVA